MKTIMVKNNISLEDLFTFSQELKKLFKNPQVLLLCGSLGSGKTTLVRFLLEPKTSQKTTKNKSFQKGTVSSPAFSIHHYYETDLERVDHVDLYRVKDNEDLESVGFWDIFSEPSKKSLIIIEWANRINFTCLPPGWNYIKVQVDFGEQKNTRTWKVESF